MSSAPASSPAASPVSPGIHHVTVIAGDPQVNLDFHAHTLGQRLVKITVNFDDPSTYHTYFADAVGTPGSVLTFFPHPGIPKGTRGSGETAATTFAVPAGALPFWTDRLARAGVATQSLSRFGQDVLAFTDPDGLTLEITERAANTESSFIPNPVSDIPPAAALHGFHGVTLASRRPDQTGAVLTSLFGYRRVGTENSRTRYESAHSHAAARFVDLVDDARSPARQAAGSVHHVAFRSSAADHLRFFEAATQAGLRITTVQERCYFRSLYFREPGGILFEIATDDPGFLIDETPESLGTALKLPPWLEPHRPAIAQGLTPLRLQPPQG